MTDQLFSREAVTAEPGEALDARHDSRPAAGVPAPRTGPLRDAASVPTAPAAPTSKAYQRGREDSAAPQMQAMRYLLAATAGLDGLLILASMGAGWLLRGLLPDTDSFSLAAAALPLAAVPVIFAAWMASLALCGSYSLRIFGSGPDEYQSVGLASLLTGLAVATASYLFLIPISRGFVASSFVVGVPMLVAGRYGVRRWLRRRRAAGALTRRVVVVGSRIAVRSLASTLDRSPGLGYQIVACTVTDPGRAGGTLPATQVGSVHDVSTTCARLRADTVMVAGGADIDLREIAWNLEGRDIDLIVVPQLTDVSGPRMHMRPVAGLPMLHVEEPQAGRAASWPKRVFDVVTALVGLVLVSPLMLVVAVLIKLDDRGPVFYRQARVGLNGEVFGCWKFRSMVTNADHIDAEIRRQHGHTEGIFKLEDDPRVTGVGRFIRRYSIDELPQLFNVIAGSMSLVGPRPHRQIEVDTYTGHAIRRLHVRPGMTGLWQVSGRSNLSWDDAVRLDLYYRDNWSLASDLLIIAKTVRAVVAKDGAF